MKTQAGLWRTLQRGRPGAVTKIGNLLPKATFRPFFANAQVLRNQPLPEWVSGERAAADFSSPFAELPAEADSGTLKRALQPALIVAR